MFHKKRILATFMYIATLILTLVVAFKFETAGGVLACVALQCAALIWYTASYIPYARQLMVKVAKSCFSG